MKKWCSKCRVTWFRKKRALACPALASNSPCRGTRLHINRPLTVHYAVYGTNSVNVIIHNLCKSPDCHAVNSPLASCGHRFTQVSDHSVTRLPLQRTCSPWSFYVNANGVLDGDEILYYNTRYIQWPIELNNKIDVFAQLLQLKICCTDLFWLIAHMFLVSFIWRFSSSH